MSERERENLESEVETARLNVANMEREVEAATARNDGLEDEIRAMRGETEGYTAKVCTCVHVQPKGYIRIVRSTKLTVV